jgi:hypothetical protein
MTEPPCFVKPAPKKLTISGTGRKGGYFSVVLSLWAACFMASTYWSVLPGSPCNMGR